MSESSDWFTEFVAALTHEGSMFPITLVSIVPPTVHEDDLFETAARENFDLAILFLNNIRYAPSNRIGREDVSVLLVQNFVSLFKKPVIGVWGWPHGEEYRVRVLQAGASAAFSLPCSPVDLLNAIKQSANIW